MSGERGSGKGAAALVPAQRWRDPERDQRSDSQLTALIYTTRLLVTYSVRRHNSLYCRDIWRTAKRTGHAAGHSAPMRWRSASTSAKAFFAEPLNANQTSSSRKHVAIIGQMPVKYR